MKTRLIVLGLFGIGLAAFVHAAPEPGKRVALVFDDGPRPADAEPLLSLLAAEKIKVTFAQVGERVQENPTMAKAVATAGHEIANHSQRHAHPRDLDDQALNREIAEAQQAIQMAAGIAPRWYWPPYLEVDDRVRKAVASAGLSIYEQKLIVVSKDYDKTVGAEEIFRFATTGVKDGAVILFHEWRKETLAQLPAILAELRRQGCTFHTFSELHAALYPQTPAASRSSPATPSEAPSGGEPLLARNAFENFKLTLSQDAAGTASLAKPAGEGGPIRVWRAETQREMGKPWDMELRVPLERTVAKGDTGLVRFRARTVSAADETGSGRLRVVVQKASPNYDKSLDTQLPVGREWQEYFVPFTFAHNFAKGAAEFAFGFGYKTQVLEIGDVELIGYGSRVALAALPRTRFTYGGREAKAPWRREALARIEQVRKGDFSIEVRDVAGAPVTGATLRVAQTRSAFDWGTCLQFKRLLEDSPDNLKYRQVALELFNAASPENDLKWPVWEGDWGGISHEQSLAALRWLNEKGIPVRGHVLVWPGWKDLPKSIVERREGKKRQKEIPDRVLAHIRDITTATKGLVKEWDVLNEPFDHHDLMVLFGNDIMTMWFKTAQECVPGVPLYLNDFSNHDMLADAEHCKNFYRTALFLQQAGAPLGGLGLQGHFGAQPNAPEAVLATLDLYAQLKLPIRFTEFDIATDDEKLQAEYTRDFLILAFSHPAVVGVQHWGFWQRTHWRPEAAMFRNDWSEKPNARIYRELVLKRWRTRLDGQSDAQGCFQARGFHGDYTVTVELGERRVERTMVLDAATPATTLKIILP